jgi:hypothetical protein
MAQEASNKPLAPSAIQTVEVPSIHVLEGEGDVFSKSITRAPECGRPSYHNKNEAPTPTREGVDFGETLTT